MQSEKRLIDTLIKHWRRRKGELKLPVYEQFMPEALGEEVWQNCCAYTVVKSNHKWIFINDFMGDYVRTALGGDLSGEIIAGGTQGNQQSRMLEKAEQVLAAGEPMADEGHFINELSKIIKFRSCLLPFGRGKLYTHIVLGLSWRAF